MQKELAVKGTMGMTEEVEGVVGVPGKGAHFILNSGRLPGRSNI